MSRGVKPFRMLQSLGLAVAIFLIRAVVAITKESRRPSREMIFAEGLP
jgi:hypothetical protein